MTHKSWKVWGEFVCTIAAAIGLFALDSLLLRSSDYIECCLHLYARVIVFFSCNNILSM
jgi:hypothetical protein